MKRFVCLPCRPQLTSGPTFITLEECLCVHLPAVQLTRGDLSRGVFIAGTYRWIVSHPGVDPDNVRYVRGCTKECAESTFCLLVSSSHHRSWPFLRAHFFNLSTLCSTWTGIDFINRTSSSASSILHHYKASPNSHLFSDRPPALQRQSHQPRTRRAPPS